MGPGHGRAFEGERVARLCLGDGDEIATLGSLGEKHRFDTADDDGLGTYEVTPKVPESDAPDGVRVFQGLITSEARGVRWWEWD